jgi:hypothetical protein
MKLIVSFPVAMLLLGGAAVAQVVTEITLPGTRVFPESITSTTDGTLYAGSLGHGNVIKTVKEGLESTPGVTATRGMAWIVEGKLNYRNDAALKDKDPGSFKLYAVPLPK